jgi:uncharacterized membrane protein
MYWYDSGFYVGWATIWAVLGIVALTFIAWLVLRAAAPRQARPDSAEDVVRKRYADGDIDRKTYKRMLAELRAR